MGCASSVVVQQTHAAPQEHQEHRLPEAQDQQVAPIERQERVAPQDRQERALPAEQQQQQHVVPDIRERHVTECGIRMSWLVSWARTVAQELGPDASTADVCAKVVIPSTRARKCRFVDIMEPEHVGPPKYFISHTWSWRFATLVDVLAQRLRGTPDDFVWLDICAINQNQYEDKGELQADDISHLADVVRKVDSTLFTLDEKGTTLTRIWCLFEIWHTVKAKGPAGLEILSYKFASDLENLFDGLDVRKAKVN